MRSTLLTAAGFTLLSAGALADANIPTRYEGRFPTDGLRRNITGTFTGKRLVVRSTLVAGKRALRKKAAVTPRSQVWTCPFEKLVAP
jgi:hypothetical protein